MPIIDKISKYFKQLIGPGIKQDDIQTSRESKFEELLIKAKETKNLQLIHLTDIHGDYNAMKKGIDFANKYSTIDGVLITGDIAKNYFTDGSLSKWPYILQTLNKPFYPVIGNHDCGESKQVYRCSSKKQQFETFIKPAVDKGYIDTDKTYYFKDFPDKAIRFIALDEFDIDESGKSVKIATRYFNTKYWTPVEYSSSYNTLKFNKSYKTGDLVNEENYTDYSFQCTNNCTITGDDFRPQFNFHKGYRVFGKTQLKWLLNTLVTTPENYGVVIITHTPMTTTNIENLYWLSFTTNEEEIPDSYGWPSYMQEEFLCDIVQAFIDGTNCALSIKYADDLSYLSSYTIQQNFCKKTKGSKFICYLSGHNHTDYIWSSTKFPLQYTIMPVCTSNEPDQTQWADFSKSEASYAYTVESINAEDQAVNLVRLSAESTYNEELRDFEKLSFVG